MSSATRSTDPTAWTVSQSLGICGGHRAESMEDTGVELVAGRLEAIEVAPAHAFGDGLVGRVEEDDGRRPQALRCPSR